MYDFNKQIDRSKTNAEKYTLREKLFGTNDVIPMWVADMDIATPQFIIDDISNRLSHHILGYEEFPSKAKEVQRNWIEKHHNYKIDIEDIIFSNSVVTSINLAIQAYTKENDEVVVQPPVYFPFFSSIKNNNRKILRNPLKKDKDGDYTFDIDDLISKITPKTKLLLLCSPHNPVGRVWKKEELEKLAEVCIKHDIKVFADEIHCDLVYDKFKHIPFASLSKEVEDITITAYGVGKTFNLASIATSTVVISNKTMKEKFKKVHEAVHIGEGNAIGHIAFTSAYEKGAEFRYELLKHLESNIKLLETTLAPFKHLVNFKRPQGTYLAWLDCHGMELNDKKLREFFVKEVKLGLSSGSAFGKEGSRHMRLNFAVPRAMMEDACENINKALCKF
ncbi:MAG: PatB family C-S lyase [Campylobacterota bacterium]|nr:PatB family C-S lyase [Campylobacterota bacterium]